MNEASQYIEDVLRAHEICSESGPFEPRCSECPYLTYHYLGRSCSEMLQQDTIRYLRAYRCRLIRDELQGKPPLFRRHIFRIKDDEEEHYVITSEGISVKI